MAGHPTAIRGFVDAQTPTTIQPWDWALKCYTEGEEEFM